MALFISLIIYGFFSTIAPIIIRVSSGKKNTKDAIIYATINILVAHLIFTFLAFYGTHDYSMFLNPMILFFWPYAYLILKENFKADVSIENITDTDTDNNIDDIKDFQDVTDNTTMNEYQDHSKYIAPTVAMIFLALFLPVLGSLFLLIGYAMTDKNDVEDKILGKIALRIALIYFIVILASMLASMIYYILA